MKRALKILAILCVVIELLSLSGCKPKDDGEEELIFDDPIGNEYANYPFPQKANYAIEPMLPSDKTPAEIDEMILNLFAEILLNDLIIDVNGSQTKDGFRMVYRHYQEWEIEEGEIKVSHINVSESQGYGMMMMAYMAGCEEELKLKYDQWILGCDRLQNYYDAMLRTVIAFPSITGENNHLFTWELTGYPKAKKNQTGYKEVDGVKTAPFTLDTKEGDSATDGDMDIIYSLLLADKQWGSEGAYNYKQIALDMLKDFWKYCVHQEYYTLLLGDWAVAIDDDVLRDATRTSDFIISHLKVFAEVDKDHDWQKVIDATYKVIKDIRDAENEKGNNNGLLPDFVVRGDNKWIVPEGEVLEGDEDNAYAYNACRIPWRLGTDYLLFGDTKIGSKSLKEYIIKPLDDFVRSYTDGDLEIIGPLYLDGKPFEWDDAETFAPELLVTAAGHGHDQTWVNQVWSYEGLSEYHGNDYGDYITIFSMMTAAGRYWLPIE